MHHFQGRRKVEEEEEEGFACTPFFMRAHPGRGEPNARARPQQTHSGTKDARLIRSPPNWRQSGVTWRGRVQWAQGAVSSSHWDGQQEKRRIKAIGEAEMAYNSLWGPRRRRNEVFFCRFDPRIYRVRLRGVPTGSGHGPHTLRTALCPWSGGSTRTVKTVHGEENGGLLSVSD